MYTDFNPFFTITTRKLWHTKFKLFQPPHLYYVATLPSETLMLYQCHYYVIIVFVYNLMHFNAFNHLHGLIWAK